MDEDEHYGPGQPMNAADVAEILAERDRLRAVVDGWRAENDRHRALYVEAVAERDRLRERYRATWDLYVKQGAVVEAVRLAGSAVLAGIVWEYPTGVMEPVPINRLADLKHALDALDVSADMGDAGRFEMTEGQRRTITEAVEYANGGIDPTSPTYDPDQFGGTWTVTPEEMDSPDWYRENAGAPDEVTRLLRAALDAAISYVFALEGQKKAVVIRARQSYEAALDALEEADPSAETVGPSAKDGSNDPQTYDDLAGNPPNPAPCECSHDYDDHTSGVAVGCDAWDVDRDEVCPCTEYRPISNSAAVRVWHLVNQEADKLTGIDRNVITGWLDCTIRPILLGIEDTETIPERERLVHENPASLERGMAEAAAGDVEYQGDFSQHLDDEEEDSDG